MFQFVQRLPEGRRISMGKWVKSTESSADPAGSQGLGQAIYPRGPILGHVWFKKTSKSWGKFDPTEY